MASWVLKEHGASGAVPTAHLLAFLQAEMAAAAPGGDVAAGLPPPQALLPSHLPPLHLGVLQAEVSDAASDVDDRDDHDMDMVERRSPHKQQQMQQQLQQQQAAVAHGLQPHQQPHHQHLFGGPPQPRG